MTKSKTFKWLPFAVLGMSIAGGPALTAGQGGCPGFTAEMIDAALLDLAQLTAGVPIIIHSAEDDPSRPSIECVLKSDPPGRTFSFAAEESEGAGLVVIGGGVTVGHSVDPPLSRQEVLACRSEALKSLAWNQYCVLALP